MVGLGVTSYDLIFFSGVLVLLVFTCPFFSANGQCKSKIKIATPCIGSCFHALSCVVTPWQCSSCCCSWLQRHRYTFVHTAMHDTFSISGLLRRWPFHLVVLFNFFYLSFSPSVTLAIGLGTYFTVALTCSWNDWLTHLALQGRPIVWCSVLSYMPGMDGGSAARKGVFAPCVHADDSCTYVPSGFVPKCKLGGYWLVSHLVCHLINST